jgi:hypothetical protein
MQRPCSPKTAVYNPKTFILHAASLRQACAHCERFSTAASRRSLGSVSVPVWLVVLSDQLPVSLGGPLPHQLADRTWAHLLVPGLAVPSFEWSGMHRSITSGIIPAFAGLCRSRRQITHALLTLTPLSPACIATCWIPFDLHASSTPPAFVLSQDQTLRIKEFQSSRPLSRARVC